MRVTVSFTCHVSAVCHLQKTLYFVTSLTFLCQVTGVVEQFNHSTPYPVYHVATTVVADTIYIFHSNTSNSDSTEWLTYYLGTTDPTADPTTDPTAVPTQPTANPSNGPTTAPSQPTVNPTDEPTRDPTMPPAFCGSVYVRIDDFDILTSDDIKYNESLQIMMDNITHFAIAEQAEILEIDRNQFFVNFYNVSPPLYMVHTLCSLEDSTLTILLSFISSHGEEISVSMEQRLAMEYGVESSDAFEVNIDTDPIELS